jgi:hypothetical protein
LSSCGGEPMRMAKLILDISMSLDGFITRAEPVP